MPENQDAWEVWAVASTQWIYGPDGPKGINMLAVIEIGKVLQVDMTPAFLHKIKVLEQAAMTSKPTDEAEVTEDG